MALCRIYLFTYRRNECLRRAVASLRAQTIHDWICELHNDDPADSFPERLARSLNDPRIIVVTHAKNLGPVRSFNLAFKPTAEPFISILEDDNWWNPYFLETMLDALTPYASIDAAWANMRIWQEEKDGSWTDTGKNVWDDTTERPALVSWNQDRQIGGALHSNSALLLRSRSIQQFVVPNDTLIDVVEGVRERAFPFPVLFVPTVCANFATTQHTVRSNKRGPWLVFQVLLIASFLKHATVSADRLKEIWNRARTHYRSQISLFFAAFVCPQCRHLLAEARVSDWLLFAAYCIRHPLVALAAFQSIRRHPAVWKFLDEATAERVNEAVRSDSSHVFVS